jgi:hypothetical protein
VRARGMVELAICAVFTSALTACGGAPPSTPSVPTTPSTGGETISGSERMGWDQPASDAGELATYRYALYVDDTRGEASDVTCTAASAGLFVCTCKLPAMASGAHTLQVAAFVLDGATVVESDRSTAVRVTIR